MCMICGIQMSAMRLCRCACLAEIEKKEKADKKKAELEQEIKALMYKRRTSLKGIRFALPCTNA